MARYLFLILLCASLIACKKVNLDALAFPYESLEHYAFDAYDDPEIIIDDSLKVDQSLVNLISMKSFSSETGEEYTIYGVYIGDTNSIATDSVILYLHGQSRHMDYYWTRSALLANTKSKYQYGVFVFDYRGYGMSEGKPSETGLYEDADAAIDWLISKGAQANRTFYYGYSLGAIPAIDRAAYREDFKPAKLIIESPLASVQYLTQSSTVITVDSKFVSTLEFDNAEKIKDIQIPLMWLHGVEDTYVSISNGELIFENAASTYKEAHRIEGAGHSEVPVLMGYSNYLQVLENFILKN
ncbi:MAG: alpha/beta hydrolase [Crocinitomicaceae bacterium]|nr:alpha/beta hydrolase [Crocinitomicaceae bacterium]MBK8926725.1 alpha/beta hydrolase [Crocinitomicaceae bacterium]